MFKKFVELFNKNPDYFVKSCGRFEIIGNHTDHNGGLCIAGSCNLAISGMLSKRTDNLINIVSEGYHKIALSLDNLNIDNDEKQSSESLVRGIAKYLLDNKYKIGGFDLYTRSSIFPGAGVSSSAAFELLIGQIFNELYNDNSISSFDLSKAGHFAENVYFGKSCGLLDQTSIAFANVSFMDFKDDIKLETLNWNFPDIRIFLVNSGGSHADLSHLYSNIPLKMKSAARKLGSDKLINCDSSLLDKSSLDEEEKRFAKHFYKENERVKNAKNAILSIDKKEFYKLINESFESSRDLLRNMQVENKYEGSPLEACDIAKSIFKDKGACKINGGGFAGSIVCFVDADIADEFRYKLYEKYSVNNVVEIKINDEKPYVKCISGLKKIMFQGDSITDAGRDRCDVHNLAGYTLEFAKDVNYSFEFVNYANSGDTSSMMISRHFDEFKNEMPDYLVFMVGVNDIWRHFSVDEIYKKQTVSKEVFADNVVNTIKESIKINPKCKIIFIEPFILNGSSNLKKCSMGMYDEYISFLKKRINGLNITYIKTNEKMNIEQNKGNILSFDGVHLNKNGERYLAKLLEELF